MTLKKMFKKICIALYFISKKIIKSCYEKVFLQPQKFVLCKFVLCKTVLAEGCLQLDYRDPTYAHFETLEGVIHHETNVQLYF